MCNHRKYHKSNIAVPDLEEFELQTFRSLRFLDCMPLTILQPGKDPISEDNKRNPDMWE